MPAVGVVHLTSGRQPLHNKGQTPIDTPHSVRKPTPPPPPPPLAEKKGKEQHQDQEQARRKKRKKTPVGVPQTHPLKKRVKRTNRPRSAGSASSQL
jgi:hypothetical protein